MCAFIDLLVCEVTLNEIELTRFIPKIQLYGHSRVGTKRLIDEYIDEVCRQLTYIAKMKYPEMALQSRITLFANLQTAFGRTALLLSGGATFGKLHCGAR